MRVHIRMQCTAAPPHPIQPLAPHARVAPRRDAAADHLNDAYGDGDDPEDPEDPADD